MAAPGWTDYGLDIWGYRCCALERLLFSGPGDCQLLRLDLRSGISDVVFTGDWSKLLSGRPGDGAAAAFSIASCELDFADSEKISPSLDGALCAIYVPGDFSGGRRTGVAGNDCKFAVVWHGPFLDAGGTDV